MGKLSRAVRIHSLHVCELMMVAGDVAAPAKFNVQRRPTSTLEHRCPRKHCNQAGIGCRKLSRAVKIHSLHICELMMVAGGVAAPAKFNVQ